LRRALEELEERGATYEDILSGEIRARWIQEAYERKNEGRLLKKQLTEEERRRVLQKGLEMKREHERATYPEFRG
jgi:hypothetical protein